MTRYKLHDYPGWPKPLTGDLQPDIRPTGRRKYELLHDYFVVVVVDDGHKETIVVPQGFTHDGASVPRLAWTLSGLTPDGPIRAAALLHDYAYRLKGVLFSVPTKRKDADKLFLDLMRAAGVSKYRSWMAYRFVRLFGPRW